MSKITIGRSVVEQALDTLDCIYSPLHVREINKVGAAMAALRAALEQPQDHSEQRLDMVPADWKLVPVEPTSEMIAAGKESMQYSIAELPAFTCYNAMLRAAPQPPTLEQPQVEQEPVAWIEHEWSGSGLRHLHFERPAPTVRDEVVRPVWTPLYLHPQPPRQPLTKEEIAVIAAACGGLASDFVVSIASAIEVAHGIGGEK